MAISGVWTNELGSTLTLSDQGGGVLKGSYVSRVGGPAGESFPLVGSYTIPTSGPISIGWIVAWAGWESTTSWCGLLFDDGDMTTTWILTETIPPGEGWWQSMNVGMDDFTPQARAKLGDVDDLLVKRGASHPLRKPSERRKSRS